MPDSPDPYLAMAPVYLYYEQDYERGMAMQEAAVKRGHAAGKRETAQMADTLKANARRDLALAQQLDDTSDRKKQHLQRRHLGVRQLYRVLWPDRRFCQFQSRV